MADIHVEALIVRDDRLLVRRHASAAHWVLPSGVLEDTDDSTEDAIARVLRATAGVEVIACEFLDTLYERDDSGRVTVHNLHTVVVADDDSLEALGEVAWLERGDFDGTALPEWLASALPALFDGSDLTQGLDLSSLAEAGYHFVRRLPQGPPLIVITGPAGAGKSTVAEALCARFERAVRIEVDVLERMVRRGRVSPVPPITDRVERARQADITRRNVAALARNYIGGDFTVVVDDVFEQREDFDYQLMFLDGLDVALVTLLPSPEVVATRDQSRPPDQRMGRRSLDLHAIFSANSEDRGIRLDTSALTVDETVDAILAGLENAWV